jgi:uncharacterized membrane protein
VGTALIALPYAAQGLAKLTGGSGRNRAAELGQRAKQKATEQVKDVVGDAAGEKLKPSLPKGIGDLVGDHGDSDSSEDATEAHGSGRRMPMQQSVDVAVPIKVAYNLWTQFEEWPKFMHRVDSAQQLDDATISLSIKIWGITKDFEAEIVEQRPDERIEWKVNQGPSHSGVVTFHRLAPRLTRIEMTVDMKPNGLVEKAGRGMRFTKRAVRGDLHRFKAFAEMEEEAEGGWRGTIEDGEVKRKSDRKSPRSQSNHRSGARSRRGRNGSDPHRSSSRSGSRN